MERGTTVRVRTRLDRAVRCVLCGGLQAVGTEVYEAVADATVWCVPCGAGVADADPVGRLAGGLRASLGDAAVVLDRRALAGGGQVDAVIVGATGLAVVHVFAPDGRVTSVESGFWRRERRLVVDGVEQRAPIRRAGADADAVGRVLAADPEASSLAVRPVVCVPAGLWEAPGPFAVGRVLVLAPDDLRDLALRSGILTAEARESLAGRLALALPAVR